MAEGLNRLPGTGLIKYGNFTFPDAYTFTVGFKVTPQLDTGKRTVTHCVWDLTLRTFVEGTPADAAVQAAVAELTKPGQAFTYEGHGAGNFRINQGGVTDVAWGPLPGPVDVRPFGMGTAAAASNAICQLTWQVSVSIPTCADAVYKFSPLEFSFSLTFDIAQNGFTTRKYKGLLRIPNNRLFPGSRAMLDSPDSYREQIIPQVPNGFIRKSQSAEIDESKTRITVTATDEEQLNTLPTYVVVGTASHNYTSAPNSSTSKWVGTIEADYEVARTADVIHASKQFIELVKSRIADTKKILNLSGIPGLVAGPGAVTTVPVAFSVSEPNIFGPGGQRGKFSFSYMMAACGLESILLNGGLWKKPGNLFNDWFSSVRSAQGPRGVAGLRFNANEDSLVDLCGKSSPTFATIAPASPLTSLGIDIGAAVIRGILAPKFSLEDAFPMPSPTEGWIEVRTGVAVEEDHGTMVVKTLPTSPIQASGRQSGWDIMLNERPSQNGQGPMFPPAADFQGSGTSTGTPVIGSPTSALPSPASAAQVQRRVTPTGFLTFSGYAVRWGLPIPCPEMVSANGQPLVNCNRLNRGEGFFQTVAATALYPIYYASWKLRYHATDAILAPGSFPVPPNKAG